MLRSSNVDILKIKVYKQLNVSHYKGLNSPNRSEFIYMHYFNWCTWCTI
jgi:hypothetical protein